MSQRLPITALENVVSNAERRALLQTAKPIAVPRVSDIYASLPSLTGKIELEYEGELKGAEHVARELVRAAVATVFDGRAAQVDTRPVIEWFERGGTLDLVRHVVGRASSWRRSTRSTASIASRRALGGDRPRHRGRCAPRSPTSSSKACAR